MTTVEWTDHAARLAAETTGRSSPWRGPVTDVPRHLLVPRWWDLPGNAGFGTWTVQDGPSDPARWLEAAYTDQTLVTQVAGVHADHADPGGTVTGRPTSSSTLPGLVVQMLDHADVYDGADVLDVATGSGYSAALLCHRLGEAHVTSIDVDPYLVKAATERLDRLGLHPTLATVDATGPLPGEYDRIVSMVSVRPVPSSWPAALRPGGRLVTVISGTSLILTATKREDGWMAGRIAWNRARFMSTRHDAGDYPSTGDGGLWKIAEHADGDVVTTGRYPVVNVSDAWDLSDMLELVAPGVRHYYTEDDVGRRTARMIHPDGSWARATAIGDERPTVHQGGPRRLWDILDGIRHDWLVNGELPARGAWARVRPDGAILLAYAGWRAEIT